MYSSTDAQSVALCVKSDPKLHIRKAEKELADLMTKKLLPRIRHEHGLQAQRQISNDPAQLRLRRGIESEGEILDLVLANKAKQRLEAIGDNARVGRESGKSFRQGIRHGRALRHSLGRVAVALRVRGAVRNALLARGPGGHLGLGGPVPGVLLLLLLLRTLARRGLARLRGDLLGSRLRILACLVLETFNVN